MTAYFKNTYPYIPPIYASGFDGDPEASLMRLIDGELWSRIAEGKRCDG